MLLYSSRLSTKPYFLITSNCCCLVKKMKVRISWRVPLAVAGLAVDSTHQMPRRYTFFKFVWADICPIPNTYWMVLDAAQLWLLSKDLIILMQQVYIFFIKRFDHNCPPFTYPICKSVKVYVICRNLDCLRNNNSKLATTKKQVKSFMFLSFFKALDRLPDDEADFPFNPFPFDKVCFCKIKTFNLCLIEQAWAQATALKKDIQLPC